MALESFTCRLFAKRASKRFDRVLRWYEYPGYWFHWALCLSCRRYCRQVKTLQNLVTSMFGEDCECAAAADPALRLSQESSKRIQTQLRAATLGRSSDSD